jgi:phosphate transport system ATP-binding protein
LARSTKKPPFGQLPFGTQLAFCLDVCMGSVGDGRPWTWSVQAKTSLNRERVEDESMEFREIAVMVSSSTLITSTSAPDSTPRPLTALATTRAETNGPVVDHQPIVDFNLKAAYYGHFKAVRDTALEIKRNHITAFIGPSGCGKTTVLRSINRMNDLVRGFRFDGHVHFRGTDVYHRKVDPVAVRRHIGMVFQQPNPFAMSIYHNVAFGLRHSGFKGNMHERVEQALRGAALWDEVKDQLHHSGLSLSGGQQQRLCIARAIAPKPQVLLMDEPCAALDPVATRKIEELMLELKERFTIITATHNLQQAERIADMTGFMYVDTSQGGRTGYLVEYGPTEQIFNDPRERHTKDYVQGAFS